jgi:surfeit locus 1 family protein
MNFRPAFWPTVMSLPAFLVLLALGTWQVERLHWKEGLIAAREAGVHAAPVALPATIDEALPLEFHPVALRGSFLHEKELYLAATNDLGTVGKHVFTPFQLTDGRIVPDDRKDPARREAGQVGGEVAIEGLIRVPPAEKPHWFVPDNRPDLNFWFYVDIPAMAQAAGLAELVPFYVDAGPAPNPGGWPRGGTTRLELPNNHLQYALTWYSLAIALAVIYFLYHRRRSVDA